MTLSIPPAPPRDCPLCPRLVDYRHSQRGEHPDWYNAPVPGFGDPDAWLAIVGLAPGLQGGNRTGRPFTGDRSGGLLYDMLLKLGLADGAYQGRADDGLALTGAIVVDAVRCAAPQNKPTPEEIRTCRPFLAGPLAALPNLRIVVAFGQSAHQSAVKALGGKLPKAPFAHLAEHRFPSGVRLLDSHPCSRSNQNSGVLTADMLEAVFLRATQMRDEDRAGAGGSAAV